MVIASIGSPEENPFRHSDTQRRAHSIEFSRNELSRTIWPRRDRWHWNATFHLDRSVRQWWRQWAASSWIFFKFSSCHQAAECCGKHYWSLQAPVKWYNFSEISFSNGLFQIPEEYFSHSRTDISPCRPSTIEKFIEDTCWLCCCCFWAVVGGIDRYRDGYLTQ